LTLIEVKIHRKTDKVLSRRLNKTVMCTAQTGYSGKRFRN